MLITVFTPFPHGAAGIGAIQSLKEDLRPLPDGVVQPTDVSA